jgi:glycosyltransferase involved in cell wall biosynthesis
LQQLRILHVFSSSAAGGTEVICAEALGAMDPKRFVHDVVFVDANGFIVDKYRRVAAHVELFGSLPLQRSIFRLASVARRGLYDAVVPYGFRANLMWRLARALPLCRRPAYVMALRSIFALDSPSRLLRALDERTSGGVDLLFANSRAGVESLRTRGYAVTPAVVAYNGVDTERFKPDGDKLAWRARTRLPLDAPIVLSTSHLRPVKNLPMLLRAFADVRRSHRAVLALAGDPILRNELEQLARELGIGDRVLFLGRRTDIPDLLRAADVFVLCSDFEGMPGGLQQAMASALPCIATNVGGVSELLEEGVSGLLVPRGDHVALAEALARTLGDAELRAHLSERARRRVEEGFTIRAMGEQWNTALEKGVALGRDRRGR